MALFKVGGVRKFDKTRLFPNERFVYIINSLANLGRSSWCTQPQIPHLNKRKGLKIRHEIHIPIPVSWPIGSECISYISPHLRPNSTKQRQPIPSLPLHRRSGGLLTASDDLSWRPNPSYNIHYKMQNQHHYWCNSATGPLRMTEPRMGIHHTHIEGRFTPKESWKGARVREEK